MAKINIDAATLKNTNMEIVAAVDRSDDKRYLGASDVEGATDVESLEVLACREAVALSRDLTLNYLPV
jgi:hypothetical protein